MNDTFEERIGRVLAGAAGRAGNGETLASESYRRAARIRRRRRIGAASAAVVAIAAVIVPTSMVIGGRTSQSPIVPPTTRPSVSMAPSPAPSSVRPSDSSRPTGTGKPVVQEISIDLAKLTRGKAPEVGWYTRQTFHHGEQATPFPHKVSGFVATAKGYLAATPDGIYFVPFEGRPVLRYRNPGSAHFVTGPVVSADGKRTAWGAGRRVSDPAPEDTRVIVADASGVETWRKANVTPYVEGFAGDRLALSTMEGLRLLHLKSGRVQSLGYSQGFGAVSPGGLLAASRPTHRVGDCGSGPDDDPWRCTEVFDLRNPDAPLWSEPWRPRAFSPSEERTVANSMRIDHQAFALLEARTGDIIRSFVAGGRQGGQFGNAVFESEDTVLVEVGMDNRWALVRCTIAGACELATEPVSSRTPEPGPGPSPVPPVRLPAVR